MTPKEKAEELYHKYYTTLLPNVRMRKNIAIQHLLIAVDLLISETFLDFYVTHPKPFWEEVKTELEKL